MRAAGAEAFVLGLQPRSRIGKCVSWGYGNPVCGPEISMVDVKVVFSKSRGASSAAEAGELTTGRSQRYKGSQYRSATVY